MAIDVGKLRASYVLDTKGFTSGATKVSRGFTTMRKGAALVSKGMTAFTSGLGRVKNAVFSLKGALAGLALGMLGKNFIKAATTAEGYRVRLRYLLGSVAEGNKLFKDMADYAGRVPFKYEDVMNAATALSGVMKGGVEEIKQWMPMIGDLAAVAGLSIVDTTSQVIRMYSAGAAAADMFRERGILSMMGFKAGVSYTTEETRKMMMKTWKKVGSQFKGATEGLSKTWEGAMSMVGDLWFKFRNMVMEARIFDYMKAGAQIFLDYMGKMEKEGKLEAWAKNIGEKVLSAFKTMAIGVAKIIDTIGPSIKAVIGGAKSLWTVFSSLPSWVQKVGIVGALMGGQLGWGIALTVGGIGWAIEETKRGMEEWTRVLRTGITPWDALFQTAEERAKAIEGAIVKTGDALKVGQGKKFSITAVLLGDPEKEKTALSTVLSIIDQIDARIAETKKAAAEVAATPVVVDPDAAKRIEMMKEFNSQFSQIWKTQIEIEKEGILEQAKIWKKWGADEVQVKAWTVFYTKRAKVAREFSAEYAEKGKTQVELDKEAVSKQAAIWTKWGFDKVQIAQLTAEKIASIDREEQQAKLNLYAGMAGSISGTFQQIAEAGGKQSALSFRAYQAFAIAEATISAHSAILKAMAAPPGGYVSMIQAAIIGAQAMMQVALISSAKAPSYDKGGVSRTPGMYYSGVPEAHVPLESGKIPVEIAKGAEKEPVSVNILNAFDPIMFDQYMASARGQEAIVNVIGARSQAVRRVLR